MSKTTLIGKFEDGTELEITREEAQLCMQTLTMIAQNGEHGHLLSVEEKEQEDV